MLRTIGWSFNIPRIGRSDRKTHATIIVPLRCYEVTKNYEC
jgi:hypothetical protein